MHLEDDIAARDIVLDDPVSLSSDGCKESLFVPLNPGSRLYGCTLTFELVELLMAVSFSFEPDSAREKRKAYGQAAENGSNRSWNSESG